jgi:hypothetical protein
MAWLWEYSFCSLFRASAIINGGRISVTIVAKIDPIVAYQNKNGYGFVKRQNIARVFLVVAVGSVGFIAHCLLQRGVV